MNTRCRARNSWLATLAFVLGATLPWLAAPGQAQSPPQAQEPTPQPPYRMAVRVELVNVEVTVSDAHGRFVGELKRENFRVLDEGIEQPLTHFASVEAPAQVLMLVETSPAVYLIHRQHLLAAGALLEGLAADDQVALATYDQSARLLVGFTPDKRALAEALDRLHYNLGTAQLSLFDSLGAALDWLAARPGKKAIVLLSTGLDTSDAGHLAELVNKLRASDVVVLPVALGGGLREPDKKKRSTGVEPSKSETGLSFEGADRALQAMAEATGGHAYFPREARDFTGIYRQITALLRHQYSLGFPPASRDARFHKIEVQIVDAQGRILAPIPSGAAPARDKPAYRIHSRRGYLAPEP